MKMTMRFRWLLMLSAAAVCGCGGSEGSKPPVDVYPVQGTVTHNGQPVVGADITFFNAEASRSAFGRTNDRGEYQLTTFSSNDGAVAGKHVVTITKVEAPLPTAPEASIESDAYVPPGEGEAAAPPPAQSAFPAKYGDKSTSGLVAVVSAETPNDKVDFTLKD